MRSLSARTGAEAARKASRPFHVLQLGYPTPIRLSSRETVDWNGATWTGGGVVIGDLVQLNGGGQKASFMVANADNSMSALILATGIAGVAVDIWMLYGAAPFAAEDGVHLFSGVIDDADDLTLTSVKLTAVSDSRHRELAPRVYFDHLCTRIPPAGRQIPWNGFIYTLEGKLG